MYDLLAYGDMIACHARMDAYRAAMAVAITPASTVLDLGAGPGVLALEACRLGVRRVYALERADIVQLGRVLAQANGFGDRITWLQGDSRHIALPERVDLLVADLRGILPLLGQNLASLIDARERFLVPGGRVIGEADDLLVAVVSSDTSYDRLVGAWEDDARGLNLGAARDLAVNRRLKVRLPREALLTAGEPWATINYPTLMTVNVAGAASCRVTTAGTAHGIVVWFAARLADGIGYTNAPGEYGAQSLYGQSFFPWPAPVALAAGDTVKVKLSADLVQEEYVWRWDSQVMHHNGGAGASFRQSSFHGQLINPDHLTTRRPSYRPLLSPGAGVDAAGLRLLVEGASLGEAAATLAERFPEYLVSPESALSHVAALAESYAKPPGGLEGPPR